LKYLTDRIRLFFERARELKVLLSGARVSAVGSEESDALSRFAAFELVLTLSQLDELGTVARGLQIPDIGAQDALSDELQSLDLPTLKWAEEQLAVSIVGARLDANFTSAGVVEEFALWREWRAVEALLRELDYQMQSPDRASAWLARCEEHLNDLSVSERTSVRPALRDYLINQWLYPWAVTPRGRSLGATYGPLFDLTGIRREESNMMNHQVIERLIDGWDLNRDLRPLVVQVIEAIERAVSENGLGGLEDIVAQGGMPFFGISGEVGIIPGKGNGKCPRVLVGIATSKSPKATNGAATVMRKVRDALIKCCDLNCSNKTEVVIFISPIGHIDSVMEESVGDIEGHLQKGILKAFIPVGVLRGHTNILKWK